MLNKKLVLVFWAMAVFIFSAMPTWAASVPEEAQRHFDRGLAAVEMARTPYDYNLAIEEFEKALALAPEWPDVYYNLGLIQEKAGKYGDAAINLRQYLLLAPNASDADTVKSLANKLEFRAEQEVTKEDALEIFGSLSDATKWRFVGEKSAYNNWVKGLSRDGDQIIVTYIYDIIKGRPSTIGQSLDSKTLTLKYQFTYTNFCGLDCDVFGQYIFKIMSKNRVQVEAVEIWPKIQTYIAAKEERLTFEYVRK